MSVTAGPTFTISEHKRLRQISIDELAVARPDLAPRPYDPDQWTSAILVTVERPEQLIGVPHYAHGTRIFVYVQSLGRVVTPTERNKADADWHAANLAKVRAAPWVDRRS